MAAESANTTPNHDALDELVNRTQQISAHDPDTNEPNTEQKIITPFITDVLNWGYLNYDCQFTIQEGTQTKRVDYALTHNNTPEIFIETKPFGSKLTQHNYNQLTSYMKIAEVQLGILTNGAIYEFVYLDYSGDTPNIVWLGAYRTTDLLEIRGLLSAFTQQSIENQESKQKLNNITSLINRRRELAESCDEIITQIRETYGESLTANELDELIQAQKTTTEKLIAETINKLPHSAIPEQNTRGSSNLGERIPPDQTTLQQATHDQYLNTRNDTEHTPEISSNIEVPTITNLNSKYGVVLYNSDTEQQFTGDVQSDVLLEIAQYLVNEHGLLDTIETPYIPEQSKIIIHTSKHYPDTDKEMYAPKRLGENHYIDTHGSSKPRRKRIKTLAAETGLRVELLGDWNKN